MNIRRILSNAYTGHCKTSSQCPTLSFSATSLSVSMISIFFFNVKNLFSIVLIKPQVEMLLRSIASDFMNRDYVKATNPKKISPTCEEFHVPLENVYFGMAATATLREIAAEAKEEDVSAFGSHCRNFLVESISQIQKRFDLGAEIHDIVQCTLAQNAASTIHLLSRALFRS